MSAAEPPAAAVTATGVGLGYGIAIAVSILVLISTIMLASYACVKVKSRDHRSSNDYFSDTTTNDTAVEAVVVVGLDRSAVESYPKVVLGDSRRLPKPNDGPCSICLSDYRPRDSVRCIPECNHCFHATCVDQWLRMSATCPLCRNSPAPSPASTPLSDSVPLAFHAR